MSDIIPKEEWDMVQLELQRRAKLRYSYSSKNCFSSKLICADCGHLYGSKLWHSTDKYKKTIWQCNYTLIQSTDRGLLQKMGLNAHFFFIFNCFNIGSGYKDILKPR